MARLISIRFFCCLFILSLFGVIPACGEPIIPENLSLDIPETVPQGSPFTVYLLSGKPVVARARIIASSGKEIAEAPVFIAEKVESFYVFVSIFSIPANAVPGIYTVRIFGSLEDANGIPVSREKKIIVTDKNFASETIRLNPTLTKLTQEYDPKKTEESEILWKILSQANPEAVYLKGNFILPVYNERRTSSFGLIRTYRYSNKKTSTAIHLGIDFAGKTGVKVSAPGRGKVVMAHKRILTGNSVIIEHLPGCYSLYYHLDSLSVAEGSFIEQGTEIGTIGMTGFATGPHLHWEVRINGIEADPDWFLSNTLLDKKTVLGKIVQNEGR